MSSDKYPTTEAICDFGVSQGCKKRHIITTRCYNDNLKRNNGKYICLPCSRKLKFSGDRNPSAKYRFDRTLFSNITSPELAYFLGWIGSDGSFASGNSISIGIHVRDKDILYSLRELVDNRIPIKSYSEDRVEFTFSSKEIANNLRIAFDCSFGKKSKNIKFPNIVPDVFVRDFIRGYFDGDGTIRDIKKRASPDCSISSNSVRMLESLKEKIPFPSSIYNNQISWSGVAAIDFLGYLYDGSDKKYRLERKYDQYLEWLTWTPGLVGTNTGENSSELFKWCKVDPDARAPYKKCASDSGWDLAIVRALSTNGNLTIFDTGIKIEPRHGIYFDAVARSSLHKYGYMLVNGIGIIDRAYRGTIKVPLLKYNPSCPDIELPFRAIQIIPRKAYHGEVVETTEENLLQTTRGINGFGSTGVK